MNKTQKYGIGLVSVIGCILIISLKAFQDRLFIHETTFWWAIGACVFFCLYEGIAINIVETNKKAVSSRQSVNLFMGLKAGKIILSIFFAMLYALVAKAEVMRFVTVFVALYLVFLAFDTIFLVYCEREAKKTNNN
jgi:hypothetical protein